MKLSDIISVNGLVGVGGSSGPGFLIEGSPAGKVDTIIVNGTGYEPLLESDRWLLEKESIKIVKGLEYVLDAAAAKNGVVTVNKKYSSALSHLKETARGEPRIQIVPIEDFYPAGEECVLVYEAAGRIVPEGGVPQDAGCVVNDVEAAINVYEAVANSVPVTKRWLTCTGEVRMPSVVCAHIGVTLKDVIDLCGGATVEDFVVITGSPVTGRLEPDLETPVNKATSGITVLPRDHELVSRKTMPLEFIIKRSKSMCRQCSYCMELCPRYLLGYNIHLLRIMNQINYGLVDIPESVMQGAILCSSCGLCDLYSCTMGIAPGVINAAIRERLISEGYTPLFPQRKLVVNEMREYRKVPNSRIIDRLQLHRYSKNVIRRWVETDPVRVEIPLQQERGVRPISMVKTGDTVAEKSLIAEVPHNEKGANVHASIEGKITFIDSERIIIER